MLFTGLTTQALDQRSRRVQRSQAGCRSAASRSQNGCTLDCCLHRRRVAVFPRRRRPEKPSESRLPWVEDALQRRPWWCETPALPRPRERNISLAEAPGLTQPYCKLTRWANASVYVNEMLFDRALVGGLQGGRREPAGVPGGCPGISRASRRRQHRYA